MFEKTDEPNVVKASDELNNRIQDIWSKIEEYDDEEIGVVLFARILGDKPSSVFFCARFINSNVGDWSYNEYIKLMTQCRKYLDDYHYTPEVMKKFDEEFGICNKNNNDDNAWGERKLVFKMNRIKWMWQKRHNNKKVNEDT